MPNTLIHMGTKVQVQFGVLDEKGNATIPLAVREDGQVGPLQPLEITITAIDDAAFDEVKAKIAAIRERYVAMFCAPPPEPPPAPEKPPEAVPPRTKGGRRKR